MSETPAVYCCSHCKGEMTRWAGTLEGGKICYDCCAELDRESMIKHGDSKRLPLYLDNSKVTNWPGTLAFRIRAVKKGRHNLAGVRYDVWFYGPDGHIWYGVQYGESNNILHSKRTNERF